MNALLLRCGFAASCISWTIFLSTLHAAEPKIEHLYPAAGQQGTTISITATGKITPWPPQIWADTEGLTFKPAKAAPKFEVEIAKDAAPGPHLVRFFGDHGPSSPYFFIVSRDAELLDAEPNDDFKSPQKIATLPATISGRLDKAGDVDSFAVTLRAGQTLVAWVEAYVLASTFDAMLRIVDANGNELAFNQDGRNLDPFLAWKAPRDGTYIVQLMGFVYPPGSDVRFAGGDSDVYRLHLTTGPFVHWTLPLAVQRGKTTSVQLIGWNLDTPHAEIDATQFPLSATSVDLPLPSVLSDQPLLVSNIPELIAPTDEKNAPQALEIPSAVTGRIRQPGNESRFTFHAIKQHTYDLSIIAAHVGSPLDAWLKIEDKNGKEAARNDDAGGSADPRLTWTAPEDGTFTAVIGDVTHRGGDDYLYRLSITEASPAVTASIAALDYSVAPGKTAELKVAIKRSNGFKQKLQLIAKDLPEGITAPDLEVSEKEKEGTLKLTAAPDAKPASQPFRLTLREPENGQEHPVLYSLANTGEDNGVPQGYTELVISATERLWITVPPDPQKTESGK